MNAEKIREFYERNISGEVDGSLDEHNLRNALLGEIAAQLAEMNERASYGPSMIFDEWFNLWDQTHDPEVRRLCRIVWNVAWNASRGAR